MLKAKKGSFRLKMRFRELPDGARQQRFEQIVAPELFS
jgi:hypothetical protein